MRDRCFFLTYQSNMIISLSFTNQQKQRGHAECSQIWFGSLFIYIYLINLYPTHLDRSLLWMANNNIKIKNNNINTLEDGEIS